jgi:hypothetical protein
MCNSGEGAEKCERLSCCRCKADEIEIESRARLAGTGQGTSEHLHELETKYAVQYSCGATLYINPTNAFGEDVTPDLGHRARKKAGRI